MEALWAAAGVTAKSIWGPRLGERVETRTEKGEWWEMEAETEPQATARDHKQPHSPRKREF